MHCDHCDYKAKQKSSIKKHKALEHNLGAGAHKRKRDDLLYTGGDADDNNDGDDYDDDVDDVDDGR